MTTIEWTEKTWNPVRGCTIVSEGCAGCYAMGQAHRFSGAGQPYEGLTRLTKKGPRWTGQVRFHPEMLEKPLRWRKPRMVFVNSMSDLFHEGITHQQRAAVLGVVAATPRHVYQVLTKRDPRPFFAWLEKQAAQRAYLVRGMSHDEARLSVLHDAAARAGVRHQKIRAADLAKWPLPNVWLGVSIESDAYRAQRLGWLREIPNALPWVSQEPQIGKVIYTDGELSWLRWIVVGGESGPRARPFDLAWARRTIAQCDAAEVPCFIKQIGAQPFEMFNQQIDTPLRDRKGGDPSEWPEDLRIRQWPKERR